MQIWALGRTCPSCHTGRLLDIYTCSRDQTTFQVKAGTSKKQRRSILQREQEAVFDTQIGEDDTKKAVVNLEQGIGASKSPGSGRNEGQADAGPSRGEIFKACAQTTLVLTASGFGLRFAAGWLGNVVPYLDPNAVNHLLANELAGWHVGITVALVAAVTGGRLALLQLWPDYAAASDRSNQMVLQPLTSLDLLWVAFLSGFSEELLFRGALIPALGGGWPAAGVSALLFGFLHQGGGRNLSFAIWAAAIGCAYGAAYLYTNDLLVPALAHSLSNLVAAAIFLGSQKQNSAEI